MAYVLKEKGICHSFFILIFKSKNILIKYKMGITQDDLAAYMGVSKAAVSKWETTSKIIICFWFGVITQ